MITTGVQCYEIDYIAKANPVSHVAGYAGEKECARAQNTVIGSWRSPEIKQHRDGRSCRQSHKEPTTERTTFLQLAESDSRVFSVNKIKEAFDYSAILTKAELTNCPGLTCLIREIDPERREQISRPPG